MQIELDKLLKKGVNVRTLDKRLDTTTMSKEIVGLIVSILGYAAEQELSQIKSRTSEGRAVALSRGVKFGRKRKYALGKTSGKANIQKNLQELGLTLNDEELKKVTERIIELGDKKERVTKEDLPFIISDVLDSNLHQQKVFVKSYVLTHSKGLKPSTTLSIEIEGKSYEESAQGDGQFDAFINALKKVYKKEGRELPKLVDYAVRIPPGSNSDALCETVITWQTKEKGFTTRGLDSDQTVSAIKATEKMLNLV